MSNLKIGDIVKTEKGSGKIAYYGKTKFADGIWVGVILDEQKGKNNGTVKNVTYFTCEENYGIFVMPDKVELKTNVSRVKAQTTSFIKPLQTVRKISNSQNPSNSGSNITTPIGTPRVTPASSLEMINRQKSFGNRSVNASASTQKLQDIVESNFQTKSNLNQCQTTNSPRLSIESNQSLDSQNFSIVKEKAQKINEKILNSSTDVSIFKPPEQRTTDLSEIDYLKREVKDLNEKLEILRFKRKEDFNKLKEYERNKINLQHLQEFKLEITQAHSNLKKENEILEKRIKELEYEIEKNFDVNRLMHQLESISLDKEMAEEKAELLQSEIDELHLKIQDQDNEIAILKSELEKEFVSGASNFNENMDSVQLKKLQQENERLRDAILRLRNAFTQINKEAESLKKDLDLANNERNEYINICEKQEQELENAKNAIVDFREQVDAAMGSERMIATLTDKNLDLEEKIHALEKDVNELETLRSMDEEIIESQKEFERDLKEDIERNMAIISDLRRQLHDFDKRTIDYENVIAMFRQKNLEVKEEVQHLKDEILMIKAQEEELSNSEDSLSLKFVTQNRVFSEIVTAELNSVELEFSRQHAVYLKSFLPENFIKTGGDNDCVLICILFPRIIAKASSLAKLLNLKFPLVPNGLRREHITVTHKAEQWAHVKKFCYSLAALTTVLYKFDSVIKTCSVERLSRLSIHQLEIAAQEKNLDMYFELLRQNRLDENTSVDNLDRIVNYFQKTFLTNMTTETGNTRDTLQNTIVQIKEGLLWIHFNCERLKHFLQISDNETSEFAKIVSELENLITECKSLAIRSINRIPVENDLLITPETNEKILNAIGSLERSTKIIHNTCSFAASQLVTIDVDGFTSTQMKEMLHSSVEKFLGSTDSVRANTILFDCITELKLFLKELSELLENSSMEILPKQKNSNPPLLERAYIRKSDILDAENLRWKLAKKDDEIIRLQKLIKAREGDISTFKIRLEMADKQIANSVKSDDAQTQHLRARCEQLNEDFLRQKNDYERKVEELKNNLKIAIEERDKKREHKHQVSKNILIANVHKNLLDCVTTPPIDCNNDTNLSFKIEQELLRLQNELYVSINDLKWAEQRIRFLEIQNEKRMLNEMKDVNILSYVCGVYSMRLHNKKSAEKIELEVMVKAADELIKESNSCLLEPFLPQEKQSYYNKIANINARIEQLKFCFYRFWNKKHPNQKLPQLYKNFSLDKINGNTMKEDLSANKPLNKCQIILKKWNTDLKEKEQFFLLKKVAA